MSEGFMLVGEEQIAVARVLTIRSMLKIQARTGLGHSRVSAIKLANEITGQNDRTARKAHASLNALIVRALGEEFDQKL